MPSLANAVSGMLTCNKDTISVPNTQKFILKKPNTPHPSSLHLHIQLWPDSNSQSKPERCFCLFVWLLVLCTKLESPSGLSKPQQPDAGPHGGLHRIRIHFPGQHRHRGRGGSGGLGDWPPPPHSAPSCTQTGGPWGAPTPHQGRLRTPRNTPGRTPKVHEAEP